MKGPGLKGRCCFICLSSPSSSQVPGMGPASSSSVVQVKSLQCLFRYLALDWRKLLNCQKETAPPDFVLGKWTSKFSNGSKEDVEVELCPECDQLGEQFAELYRELELVHMRVGACLGRIHWKLEQAGPVDDGTTATADKTGQVCDGRIKTDPDVDVNSTGGGGGMLMEEPGRLELLRRETMRKCSQKLNAAPPRVQLEDIKPMPNYGEGICSSAMIAQFSSDPDIEIGEVKVKSTFENTVTYEEDEDGGDQSQGDDSADSDCQMTDNNHSEDDSDVEVIQHDPSSPIDIEVVEVDAEEDSGDDSDSDIEVMDDIQVDKPPAELIELDLDSDLGGGASESDEEGDEDDSNLATRKCSHCSRKFKNDEAYMDHYNKVHRPPRPFQTSPSLPPQPSLMDLRKIWKWKNIYGCEICHATFPSKKSRWDHQRDEHCGNRSICEFCGAQFKQPSGRVTHLKKSRTCHWRRQPS